MLVTPSNRTRRKQCAGRGGSLFFAPLRFSPLWLLFMPSSRILQLRRPLRLPRSLLELLPVSPAKQNIATRMIS
jgi:hypothetical protein